MKRQISDKKLNNKVTCQICSYICKNYISLAKHLQHQHQMKSQEYYNKYLLKENENICTNTNCNNTTRFINLGKGYVKTCSGKCYGIIHTGENNSFYDKHHTKEAMDKMVSTRMDNGSYAHTQETKDKIRKALKGREHDWGVSGTTGTHRSDETKEKIRQSRYRTIEENFKKYGRAESIETTEKKIKASLAVVCKRPNRFEADVGEYLEELFPSRFQYVGNGSVMINGRSPDYIDKKNKIVVLCHGLYWHLLRYNLKDTPENKRSIELEDSEPFLKAGYDAWFIWEIPHSIKRYEEEIFKYSEHV